MALKQWDGRAACSVELADSYYASEAAVPIMGVGYVFQRGVTDPAHPYARQKTLALTYAEASSLADGRFDVTKIEDAPSDESKTDRAKKKAAATESGE